MCCAQNISKTNNETKMLVEALWRWKIRSIGCVAVVESLMMGGCLEPAESRISGDEEGVGTTHRPFGSAQPRLKAGLGFCMRLLHFHSNQPQFRAVEHGIQTNQSCLFC
jgi:hypothetical protein